MDKIKIAADGAPVDRGGHNYVGAETLAQFKDASEQLSRFKAPIFLHANDMTERLYVVAFDGTGNNQFEDPEHATNVAKISNELTQAVKLDPHRLHVNYIEGPGTRGEWLDRKLDTIKGSSFESNITQAYNDLVIRANRWMVEDPDAKIRVQSIGFSRGASQVAGFANLLHGNGIPDLSSEIIAADGTRGFERYFVAPGKTPQAVLLFDPVATGAPMEFDRRLPSSVVSGLQITAKNELRATFPSDQLIRPGLSEDGRFLNITVPGAHSDVGGGYLRNGLSIRCGNLGRDYCNAFHEVPKLTKEFEPTDQRLNVVHRSWEGEHVFRLDPRQGVRGFPSGTNQILAPSHVDGVGPAPHGPAAMNPSLSMPMRNIPIGKPNLEPVGVSDVRPTAGQLAEAGRAPSYAPAIGKAVGLGLTAVDIVDTGRAVTHAADTGNETGATSQIVHFAGRNAGGWAGAAMFASAAGAAGIETGPGALIATGIGGIVGAVGGAHLADEYDIYRSTHQEDAHGRTWELDPEHGWARKLPPLPETPHGEIIVADAALSRRLSYQATNTATEIALSKEYQAKDPYKQPPAPTDAPVAHATYWSRDAEKHTWSREVTDLILEHDIRVKHIEHATPEKAAQLDASALDTIRQNVAQSPVGVAERYIAAYEQNGWKELGAIPPAVQDVLRAPRDQVLASDGHAYTHEPGDTWSRERLIGKAEAPERLHGELAIAETMTQETRLRVNEEVASIDRSPAGKPGTPPSLDAATHPDHAMFNQARSHLAEVDKGLGRAPDEYTDNMAAALTVQARKDGLSRIDQVALSDDGKTMWAVQTPPGRTDHLFDLQTKVPTSEAMTSMEQSSAKWPQAMQQFQANEQQAAIDQQQAQQQRQQQDAMGHGRSM
ncbi:DUF2235 domain-containing protein [Bacillus sp. NP157]|nr:DUF2235 domain-containing protein [Bacillus sp. NP157]